MTSEQSRAQYRIRYLDAVLTVRQNLEVLLVAMDTATNDSEIVEAIASVLECEPAIAEDVRWLQLNSLAASRQEMIWNERAELRCYLGRDQA